MTAPDYFVLCETTTTDEQGRMSLINIFDSITVDELPASADSFTVAFSIELPAETFKQPFKMVVEITSPEGKAVFSAASQVKPENIKAELPKTSPIRMVSGVAIKGAKFTLYGEYKYRLFKDKELLKENCLRIIRKGEIIKKKAKKVK